MDYHIEDFTEENYRKLLRMARNNFEFIQFSDIDKIAKDRVVIWRHDIDYSVHRALALAKIEAEEGVRAVFFVHLHSAFYHIWEKEITELIIRIQETGGEIGLHFDPAYYDLKNTDYARMEKMLCDEKRFLESIIGKAVNAFSFHNPDTGGGFLHIPKKHIAGMVNVYHASIRKEFTYCSDSNGYWRFQRLEELLHQADSEEENDRKLHILTHPAWWQQKAVPPRERIKRSIYGRAAKAMQDYDDFLKQCGRINVH